MTSSDATVVVVTADDRKFEIPKRCADTSTLIKNMLADLGCGEPIPLPNIQSAVFTKVLEYMSWLAKNPDKSTADGDVPDGDFEKNLVACDNENLFDIIMAANYLEIKPLMHLACRSIAQRIRGKSPEQIRELFGIENDFTPEEEEAVRKENEWCQER